MNMKIKIVVGVLSLLGMQYVVAADPKEDDIVRRLAIHSNYYATALKWSKAANPSEYYNDFLKSTEKVEDIQFNGILEILKNADDESEQGLLNSYTKYQNVIDDCGEKRAAIIELLKAADYLDIQAHALISACVDDLSELCKQCFKADPQVIAHEADNLSMSQQRLMTERILKPYQYDLKNICIKYRLVGHEGPVNSVVYSPDGSRLASGSTFTVIIWDVASGELVHKLTGHNSVHLLGAPKSMVFSSNSSRLVVNGGGYDIVVWDVISGRPLRCVNKEYFPELVFKVYDPVDLRLDRWSNKPMIIWSLASVQQKLEDCFDYEDCFDGESFEFWRKGEDYSSDHSWVLSSLYSGNTSSIYFINVKNKKIVYDLLGHEDSVCCVAYGPDGLHLASGSRDETVIIWSILDYKEIVDSVSVAQALYICYRLAELQKPSLEETSSQEIGEDERVEPFYESLANCAAVSMLSLFGVDQLEGAVKLLGNEELRFQKEVREYHLEEDRKSYLAQLHDSLSGEIREFLDDKCNKRL